MKHLILGVENHPTFWNENLLVEARKRLLSGEGEEKNKDKN